MVDLRKIAEMLQDSEIIILKSLAKKDFVDSHRDLSQSAFYRSAMYLENKKLVDIIRSEKQVVTIDRNGKTALEVGLPELRLLEILRKEELSLDEAEKRLGGDELRFAMGYCRKSGWISINNSGLKITSEGRKVKSTEEFNLLKQIGTGELDLDKLRDFQHAYITLSKRKKMISTVSRVSINLRGNARGEEVLKVLPKGERLEKLTPAMLKSGKWKGKKFRRFDVEAPVPIANMGKKQLYLQFLDDVRLKMVELGFEEMDGPLVETQFWNFDALYQPQNHPARTWTDTYFLKNPKSGKLPESKIVEAVKSAHENGGKSGSIGWGYTWSKDIAKQLMPRAHTTSVSARMMAGKFKVPGKYFTIGRVFRPDVLDATHLIEFNQLEFMVTDENLNIGNLMGVLRKLAEEFAGATKFRFFPDYYPFTEPSVQIDGYSPELGTWVELGGAGIFRPEITETLGISAPVLAGAFGIDRLFQKKIASKDIRELYSDDLSWLKRKEVIL